MAARNGKLTNGQILIKLDTQVGTILGLVEDQGSEIKDMKSDISDLKSRNTYEDGKRNAFGKMGKALQWVLTAIIALAAGLAGSLWGKQ